RLQRDGLAAGVRPADDQRVQIAEIEVDRNGSRSVEQRMACTDEANLVRRLDRRTAPAPREDAARDGEVDRTGRLDQRIDGAGVLADSGRKVAEDALDLLALRRGCFRLAVAELDDLERLDEERLPGAGRVVDDPLHTAPRARLEGEHRPPAAL